MAAVCSAHHFLFREAFRAASARTCWASAAGLRVCCVWLVESRSRPCEKLARKKTWKHFHELPRVALGQLWLNIRAARRLAIAGTI